MIIIIGVAGAGKSTQCEMLAADGEYQWLSVGQLLRETIVDSPQKAEMEKGDMLADGVVIPMVEAKIQSMGDDPELVLDGFPRTTKQVDRLLETHKSGDIKISHVIHLVVDEETAYNRLLTRGRTDDYAKAISERFREYKETIVPIIEDFAIHGVVVASINGEQESKVVQVQLRQILGK